MVLTIVIHSQVKAAPPPLPAGFYGTVTIRGANVPTGTEVLAWINGILCAKTTTFIYRGVSVYGLDVPGDDPDTPHIVECGTDGAVVGFMVNGQAIEQTDHWHSGVNVQVNLEVGKNALPTATATEALIDTPIPLLTATIMSIPTTTITPTTTPTATHIPTTTATTPAIVDEDDNEKYMFLPLIER